MSELAQIQAIQRFDESKRIKSLSKQDEPKLAQLQRQVAQLSGIVQQQQAAINTMVKHLAEVNDRPIIAAKAAFDEIVEKRLPGAIRAQNERLARNLLPGLIETHVKCLTDDLNNQIAALPGSRTDSTFEADIQAVEITLTRHINKMINELREEFTHDLERLKDVIQEQCSQFAENVEERFDNHDLAMFAEIGRDEEREYEKLKSFCKSLMESMPKPSIYVKHPEVHITPQLTIEALLKQPERKTVKHIQYDELNRPAVITETDSKSLLDGLAP
jgi:hypothetical protein